MAKSKHLNNILNINSANKFLPTLAIWILEEYKNGSYLSNLTILLPSRRACRELKKEFLNLSSNEALLLPNILAIGDVDYDENLFESFDSYNHNKIEYRFELISAIKNWNDKHHLFGKNISTASLAEVADNLQTFLDEVEKEGVNLDDLEDLDDSELASHKQQILKFLRYFGSAWQNILIKKGLVSEAKKQSLNLKNYNYFLKANGSPYPIIAAGSTGSVSASADLLKTIAHLKNGQVILFGLDKNLDEEIWNKIEEHHPQFMLKKLLAKIGFDRKDVSNIGDDKNSFVGDLLSLSMLPAEFSDRWKNNLVTNFSANSITKIETDNEFDEAKIIALLMRETLETKDKTAALISNDKNLISQVKANLSAWQVEIDDSKISNLSESELANYLFLISEFCLNDFSASNLLAVLKHRITNVDKRFLAILEMDIFRDVVKFSSFEDVILKINDDELANWIKQISKIFKPLINEFKKEKIDFQKAFAIHFECFSLLQKDNSNEVDGNEELSEFNKQILNTKINLELEPQSYSRLLQNLLKNYQFRKSGFFHPRLHVLSHIEARLMSYDLTIVSGLIEGEFPAKSNDDWLGNKLRSELGLSSSSKKIGILAYDFCNYLSAKEIVLLSPKNQNNSPTIKSRFLLKLETVLKINGLENFFKNGEEYLQLLNVDSNEIQKNIQRTNPKPTKKLEKISVTDISKWLKNPYYIYAKRILQLKPLKRIEQEASFAEFGNFVHKTLEEFVKDYPKINLENYGKKIFAQYFPDPAYHLLWWPRFENIAKWFVKEEEKLRENLKESFTEIEVEALISGILITTKIDRINLYQDGNVEIIDYKTGSLPFPKEIKSGLEPQLAMEAIVLSYGTIKHNSELKNKIDLTKLNNLQYQNLKGKDQNEVKDLSNIEELVAAADEGIVRLIELFSDKDFGYICAPNLDIYKEDDYWHLARIGEL